jgi:membrane-bound lytic murein transglycosylase
VTVLEAMEREVRGLKQDYEHAVDMLNENDKERFQLVLNTHEQLKELIYSRVRTEATAKFHAKIEKTIARGGEFADALQLWYDYIELEQRFRDVQFNTIAIKNKQLEEWFREYAKRKDR